MPEIPGPYRPRRYYSTTYGRDVYDILGHKPGTSPDDELVLADGVAYPGVAVLFAGSPELLVAAQRVWKAYLAFGPVDDGRPEGDAFTAALDDLMKAKAACNYRPPARRKARKK